MLIRTPPKRVMTRTIRLVIAAGAISALIAAMPMISKSYSVLFMFYLAVVPLYMVGFSYGFKNTLRASALGVSLAGLIGGIPLAAAYGLIVASPALIVSYVGLQSRTVSEDEVYWYAPGGVFSWLTLWGLVLITVLTMIIPAGETIEQSLELILTDLFSGQAMELKDEAKKAAVQLASLGLGLAATGWLIVSALLAGVVLRVLERAGSALRPSQAFRDLALPNWLSWPLVAATVAVLLGSGEIEYIGRNVALLMSVPFFFLGLAVVHTLARYVTIPGVLLAAVYVVVLYSGWFALVVVGIGLIEQWFGLRHRFGEAETEGE